MELVVYSSLWCPDCRVAKRFLQGHNIPFKEVDIETTPGAADEVIARTGKRAIPQFVIDGEWVQPYRPGEGFLYEEMSATPRNQRAIGPPVHHLPYPRRPRLQAPR